MPLNIYNARGCLRGAGTAQPTKRVRLKLRAGQERREENSSTDYSNHGRNKKREIHDKNKAYVKYRSKHNKKEKGGIMERDEKRYRDSSKGRCECNYAYRIEIINDMPKEKSMFGGASDTSSTDSTEADGKGNPKYKKQLKEVASHIDPDNPHHCRKFLQEICQTISKYCKAQNRLRSNSSLQSREDGKDQSDSGLHESSRSDVKEVTNGDPDQETPAIEMYPRPLGPHASIHKFEELTNTRPQRSKTSVASERCCCPDNCRNSWIDMCCPNNQMCCGCCQSQSSGRAKCCFELEDSSSDDTDGPHPREEHTEGKGSEGKERKSSLCKPKKRYSKKRSSRQYGGQGSCQSHPVMCDRVHAIPREPYKLGKRYLERGFNKQRVMILPRARKLFYGRKLHSATFNRDSNSSPSSSVESLHPWNDLWMIPDYNDFPSPLMMR